MLLHENPGSSYIQSIGLAPYVCSNRAKLFVTGLLVFIICQLVTLHYGLLLLSAHSAHLRSLSLSLSRLHFPAKTIVKLVQIDHLS